jgi:hypothetical protein
VCENLPEPPPAQSVSRAVQELIDLDALKVSFFT